MKDRNRNLVTRLSDEELAMAHRLAEEKDVPMTALVRRLLRDAYVDTFGLEKPKDTRR